MRYRNALQLALCLLPLVASALVAQRPAEPNLPVVMISIDGMHPSYVLEADRLGLKIPNLRRLASLGSYASGVRGVVPTVTYPSHATLVTGVSPARHGVESNTTFDPLGRNRDGWFWYAEDLKVPALWDAAAGAHLTTAAVNWPVTVGANITWNIPQIWRTGERDDRKLQRAVSTPGLVDALEHDVGQPYVDGKDESLDGDRRRAKFAAKLIAEHKPALSLVYFTGLDLTQHATGPFSPAAIAALEKIDAAAGDVAMAAWRAYGGKVAFVVVSDHGFLPAQRQVNLSVALRDAGLLSFVTDASPTPIDWKAAAWLGGGSIAVMLRDSTDEKAWNQTHDLLHAIAADTANGVAEVLTADEVRARGGYTHAAFVLSLREGFTAGTNVRGALVTASFARGTHGELPGDPRLDAAFFVAGPGIPRGVDFGRIDQRDVAPTVAAILGVALPTADGRNVLSAAVATTTDARGGRY